MTGQTVDLHDQASPDPTEPGPSGAPMPPPAGPSAGPAGRPVWYRTPVSRDPHGRKVGGVVGGISRAFGFDVRTTRIAVAVATLLMPVLLVVYALAWLVLPDTPAEARPLQDVLRDRRRLPLMIVVALLILGGGLGWFGSWHFLGGLPWGVGLIALGVLLWVIPGLRSDDVAPAPLPPPPSPAGAGADAGADPGSDARDSDSPAETARLVPGAPTDPAARLSPSPSDGPITSSTSTTPTTTATPTASIGRRRRVPIGLFAVLAALGFLGVGALGDAADWWNLPTLTAAITVLAVLAVGAGVSALVNRSWRTVPLLVLLTFGLSALSVTQPDLDGGVGERTVRPSTLVQAQTLHRLGVGRLTVDLTTLGSAAETGTPRAGGEPSDPITVRVRLGVGQLRVVVPADAVVVLDASVGAGHVVFDGRELAEGCLVDGEWQEVPAGPAGVTLRLDAEVGMGELTVERAPGG